MYLDVADSPTLPYGWSRYAQFSLAVVNQIHGKYTLRKGILCSMDFIGFYFICWIYLFKPFIVLTYLICIAHEISTSSWRVIVFQTPLAQLLVAAVNTGI